jgi:hypothetical protein
MLAISGFHAKTVSRKDAKARKDAIEARAALRFFASLRETGYEAQIDGVFA